MALWHESPEQDDDDAPPGWSGTLLLVAFTILAAALAGLWFSGVI